MQLKLRHLIFNDVRPCEEGKEKGLPASGAVMLFTTTFMKP
jgi:hypothetical protein